MRRAPAVVLAPSLARLAGLACLLLGASADAVPRLALRPGGTAFEGPTDPEVTSLWWNPAAISQLRGAHLLVDGQLLLSQGSIDRSPICAAASATGPLSCADRSFPRTPVSDLGWTGFAGVTWDFRQENLAIGFAVSMPWEQHRSFAGADNADAIAGSGRGPNGYQLPVAYQLRSQDFRTLYFTLGLAVKLSQRLSFGAAVSVVDSWASIAFDRDTAPGLGSTGLAAAGGYESPSAAQKVKVSADGGPLWSGGPIPSPSGLGISVGLMAQPVDGIFLGASWQRMFPFNSTGGRFTLSRATLATINPSSLQEALGCSPCTGGAAIVFDLPDVWSIGLRVVLPHNFEIATWGRVVVYGNYSRGSAADDALVIDFSGAPVQKGVVPGRLVLGRGLQPAVAGELGVRWRPVAALRLGLSIATESSSVGQQFVSAAALDGPKLDGMLAAEVRLRWFRLMAGYALTGYFLGTIGGGYDPTATTTCVDKSYSLDYCTKALRGEGLPSNAGSYSLLDHRFSLALGFDY